MTPTISKPRSRRPAKAPASTAAGRGTGHRRKLVEERAPRAPRRVSGPLGGRVAAERAASSRVAAPRTAPRFVRRGRTRRQLAPRALAFVRALPDHRLLDRVIRGRAWIPLLGLMRAGIVAMQVEVLK